MKTRFACAALLVCICLAVIINQANANAGMPDSGVFGYGARLDLNGQNVLPALNAASALGMDWVAVDFDWAKMWPDRNQLPDLTLFGQVLAQAKQANLQVLLSIKHSPAWASGLQGPDPELAAQLVADLARLYPGLISAVELFPEANTSGGWGAAPNPEAYTQLVRICYQSLQGYGLELPIVVGGLSMLPAVQPESGIKDTPFLVGMYQAGIAPLIAAVSLHMDLVTGKPDDLPQSDQPTQLRHYEEVRDVMLAQGDEKSMLWITSLAWPTSEGLDLNAQANWVLQAYQQMQGQVYIGVAFFDQLNPPPSGLNSHPSLIRSNGQLHPAGVYLGNMISSEKRSIVANFHSAISKKTPSKLLIKHLP